MSEDETEMPRQVGARCTNSYARAYIRRSSTGSAAERRRMAVNLVVLHRTAQFGATYGL